MRLWVLAAGEGSVMSRKGFSFSFLKENKVEKRLLGTI